jgi:hypothetical protein
MFYWTQLRAGKKKEGWWFRGEFGKYEPSRILKIRNKSFFFMGFSAFRGISNAFSI